MESVEYHQAVALLAWQVELGATEALCDAPVNRYALPQKAQAAPKPEAVDPVSVAAATVAAAGQAARTEVDPVDLATRAAAAATSLEELRAAIAAFDACELRNGARNMVFSDGVAGGRLMVIGDSPTREEDRAGKPFVGREGQLLDRMLAAIDMSRDSNVYITSALPWRTPQDRSPRPDELALMRPFLARHIALAQPAALLLVGRWACQALLGAPNIARLRGTWAEACGLPALPIFHPTHLMRTPEAKRETWADLLSLKARLRDG
tara:strand:+ start:111195 stop:111989 length:795 start_codon:yes stop_codon:yes gene_type:complete